MRSWKMNFLGLIIAVTALGAMTVTLCTLTIMAITQKTVPAGIVDLPDTDEELPSAQGNDTEEPALSNTTAENQPDENTNYIENMNMTEPPEENPEESGFVEEERIIDPERPMIALTFDDGPSRHTMRILDVLEEYNGLATFCVMGNLAQTYDDVLLRAYEMGNDIASHTTTHRNLTLLTPEEIMLELLDANSRIESVTGEAPTMLRLPYGRMNSDVADITRELGIVIIGWSVDPADWRSRNADMIYDSVMNDVFDRSIVLCHDIYETTAEAIERIVPDLVELGYQLVTVTELLEYTGETVEPGIIYKRGKIGE